MKNSSRPEDLFGTFGFLFVAALVKRRVDRVEVFAIKLFLRYTESISKALIVYNFALTQVAQRITYVRVIAQTDEVVVGRARLLLCYYHVFATKLSLAKARKILMFQGISALLKLTIFQKFQ